MNKREKAENANAKAILKYTENLRYGKKKLSEKSIQVFERAMKIFQEYFTDDFRKLTEQKCIDFLDWLEHEREPILSDATRVKMQDELRKFFEYLADEPGYRSKKNMKKLAGFLAPKGSDRNCRVHVTSDEIPSMDTIIKLYRSIEDDSDRGLRDKAIIAMLILSGIRVDALISLPLCAFDTTNGVILQDPSLGVKTKFSKAFPTVLVKINSEMYEFVINYAKMLKTNGYKENNPLFPNIQRAKAPNALYFAKSSSLSNDFIESTGTIRRMLEERCKDAGVKYYPPHKFRHRYWDEVLGMSRNRKDDKALSQNIGHEKITTTFKEYGNLSTSELIDRIHQINEGRTSMGDLPVILQNLPFTEEEIDEMIAMYKTFKGMKNAR